MTTNTAMTMRWSLLMAQDEEAVQCKQAAWKQGLNPGPSIGLWHEWESCMSLLLKVVDLSILDLLPRTRAGPPQELATLKPRRFGILIPPTLRKEIDTPAVNTWNIATRALSSRIISQWNTSPCILICELFISRSSLSKLPFQIANNSGPRGQQCTS